MINRKIWDVALATAIGCLIGLPIGGYLIYSESIWTTEQLEGITVADAYLIGVATGKCGEIHKMNSTAHTECVHEEMCEVAYGKFAEECERRRLNGTVTQ